MNLWVVLKKPWSVVRNSLKSALHHREKRDNIMFFHYLIFASERVQTTRFSFYKNILYKNIEDEMGQKVKNILRICSS